MSICEGCHAGCCRAFAVPLSGADVVSIEQGTGRDFWQFACRWEDSDGLIARKYAPHLHFDDEPDTPFVLCLRHEASALFPRTTKCLFLEESPPDAEHPLGTARCGNYAHRPHACRAFPMKLDAENSLAVIHPVPERARDGGQGAYELCPRPWTVEDVEPVQAVRDLVVARHEMEFFRTVAQVWNRRPGPWVLFPEFLRIVYSRRVQLEEEDQAIEEMARTIRIHARPDEGGTLAA